MAKRTKTAGKSARRASSRKKSAREEKTAARRDEILAAALEEFSSRGFESTRLDDVAKRAKIAKGTIYLYFRDKETLFQELVRAMLTPLVGTIEALGQAEIPTAMLADRIADLFVNEIYETKRKDVIRLLITEGRRFPKLAEFFYREVLSHLLAAMRTLLARAEQRGEVPKGLAQFPQLIAAPGIVSIIWNGLFARFEPLDVRALMKTHLDILFKRRVA